MEQTSAFAAFESDSILIKGVLPIAALKPPWKLITKKSYTVILFALFLEGGDKKCCNFKLQIKKKGSNFIVNEW